MLPKNRLFWLTLSVYGGKIKAAVFFPTNKQKNRSEEK